MGPLIGTVTQVEDPTTPWLIAETSARAGMSVAWAWLTLLLGAAVVLAGGFLLVQN